MKYIITSAINNIPLNDKFWQSLIRYSRFADAEIIVIPQLYKNPTAQGELSKDDISWPEEVEPYLCTRKRRLCKELLVLGDIPVQATAQNPCAGLDTHSGEKSCIIGHARIQLATIATRQGKLPKIITSTGSVSRAHYSRSKSGAKARHHHVYGATMVETNHKGGFHLRQLNCTGQGSFIDLDHEVFPDKVRKAPPAAALIMGDSHWRWHDPVVAKATFVGKKSIVGTLKPNILVHHDSLDFHAQNHHNIDDEFITYQNYQEGISSVQDELDYTIEMMRKYCDSHNNVVVSSNHDEAFDRWLKFVNIKNDPQNAELYYRMKHEMIKDLKHGKQSTAFGHYAKGALGKNWKFLKRDQSHSVKGIELGHHGDKGINGARGSRKSFTKIGCKAVIGHSHSPGIDQGVYQTGTSTYLTLGYTQGPSSWLNTHCIIYANGKRSLINIIEGDWRS